MTQLVDLQHMRITYQIETTRAAISMLKYSPNSESIAVGTKANTLEIYSTQDNKRRAALKKYSGTVNHIDWSIDSGLIQTTSEASELIFIQAEDMKQITNLDEVPALLNETWNTQSCVYGWSVQGIWKDHMRTGIEVNMVDRSHNRFYGEYHALAAADDFGDLRVYKYPCVQPEAQAVLARGHSSFVSNVKWSANDKYIITTGGEDQTIIMWRVEKTG
jgi:WD40 repeat protein